ncbi:MAG: hypothetical protein HKN80_05780 [Acidimicrobiia bacterium]|nr:hypothetical protein [Acidimicrobiia bacterium]
MVIYGVGRYVRDRLGEPDPDGLWGLVQGLGKHGDAPATQLQDRQLDAKHKARLFSPLIRERIS